MERSAHLIKSDFPNQATGKVASLSELVFTTDDMKGLGDFLLQSLATDAPEQCSASNRIVTYINPHVYNLSMVHPDVKRCLDQADRVCIDGVGIKLALMLKQRKILPRVVAEQVFNDFVRRLDTPVSAVLIGVQSEDVINAAESLAKHNNNLTFADVLDGFGSNETYRQFFQKHASIPLVLIGAGTPRSEQIALMAADMCHGSVIFHIGAGTIKTWAGTKRCGPALMSRLGLEWLHRIVFEPHTRARYTVGAVEFARNLIGSRQSPAHQTRKGENT